MSELVSQIDLNDFRLRQFPLPLPEDTGASDAYALNTYGTPAPDARHDESWPVLYVLTNDAQRTAYIGETTNYRRRMNQHVHNPKKDFTRSLLIDSPSFNQSSTFDYENRLIELFLADEKYRVTNQNNGYGQFNYFQREQYRQQFRNLWNKLHESGYAIHPIEELENTDLFKYSPFKTLTPDQYEVIEDLIGLVRRKEDICAVINGAPGTGKTILAVSLLFKIKNEPHLKNLHVGFISPIESLRKTLKETARSVEGLRPSDIIGPSDVERGERYDVLLVDEAHRLTDSHGVQGVKAYRDTCDKLRLSHDAHQLDWILSRSSKTILFFDEKQQVKGTGMNKAVLSGRLDALEPSGRQVQTYSLSTQMRVKGGDEYLDFVYDLFSNHTEALAGFDFHHLFCEHPFDPSKATEGAAPLYQLAIVEDFGHFCQLQQQKEAEAGLSRMMAGYAWDWKSKKDPTAYDISIDGISKRWNSTSKNWVNSPDAVNEVGCVHTVQGFDLNYGFVIIGDDLQLDPSGEKLVPNRKGFKDQGAKRLTDETSLMQVIVNTYYVLMTRGMQGTFLYICDPTLRAYFSRWIRVI